MKSGYFAAAGAAGGAFGAHAAATTTSDTTAARMIAALPRRLSVVTASPGIELLRWHGRRQPLDEAPRHVGFDHDLPVGRDMTQHTCDSIQPTDLLAIELV